MKKFLDAAFLLDNPTAEELYHHQAALLPIVDMHNHLNPREIALDCRYDNLTEAWLSGDHYKWRLLRANGIPEALITGDASPREKFNAWAETVPLTIGNPIYHWTQLELSRYFGIQKPLSPDTADEIWVECNEKLQTPACSVRGLLRSQHVEVLCTTDDPADDLRWHRQLREEGYPLRVLPSFRPDRFLHMERPDFPAYIRHFEEMCGQELSSADRLIEALSRRLDYFIELGCRSADHSLEESFRADASYETANRCYQKRLSGKMTDDTERTAFRGWLLRELGTVYAARHIVMQLHIGARRNNSTRLFSLLGADAGADCMSDRPYSDDLILLLDVLDACGSLPRTVLYYLNPKDADLFASIAGSFQANDEGIRGKVQLGPAWWFCDHRRGMEQQMDALSDLGLLSTFIGMTTDSRSFLSFPRHEYFRRILCSRIGRLAENGEYPDDPVFLGRLIENICCENARIYFRL